MAKKLTYLELDRRIREVVDANGGHLPAADAFAWAGYIAALLEWNLISPNDHAQLQDLLGPESASPILTITLGVDGAREVMERESVKA
jgi:hypothetical protein